MDQAACIATGMWQHVDRHALTVPNVFDKAGYCTQEQTLMAYANLHNDDRPAMPENSFTCIVLTNRQTEKTQDMVVVTVMMSARQQHHCHRQVAKQWHVSLSIMKHGSHGTKHWEQHCKAHMIQSIGNSIVWLILTRLDDRCILQLYLKVMPGVVECLRAQHERLNYCSRHAIAGRVRLQPQHTQKTSHKHHVHM